MSNDVPICQKKGLHSLRLLPHFTALKAHLDSLEAMPPTSFTKPPHLGPLAEGYAALEDACNLAFGVQMKGKGSLRGGKEDQDERRVKIRVGYERLTQTLWRVAREFDVRGYGSILREKLTNKWCDCGCSTDHLSEVCERTVRDGEETAGLRAGKGREWDGRGESPYLLPCSPPPKQSNHTQVSGSTVGRPTKRKTSGMLNWTLRALILSPVPRRPT
jgi:hypothetical protein